MAVGDVTILDSYTVGDHWEMRGTIDVDTTPTAFAFVDSSSYLLWVNIQSDNDGTPASYAVQLNVNAADTAVNGTATINSSAGADSSVPFTAGFLGS